MGKRILAIGGGKGGVGKSVITANLGIELASRGKRTIVVDADFGAANLHVCLGMKSPKYSFSDFMLKRKAHLEEILLDTGIDNLKFISGSGDMPGSANIKYWEKMKIINHLEKLPADYILLDLAPGDSFNVIDYFSIADYGILVTTPEPTSLINTYSFIKSSVFRKLEKAFKETPEIQELINIAKDTDNDKHISSIEDLLQMIKKAGSNSIEPFTQILSEFHPKLIINMVTDNTGARIANTLRSLAKKYVSIDVDTLGFLYEDDTVRESIFNMQPFVIRSPHSRAAFCIQVIVDNLMKVQK